MTRQEFENTDPCHTLDEVLGYINLSSGADDPRFFRNLDAVFADLESSLDPANAADVLDLLRRRLSDRLSELAQTNTAFGDVAQAQAILELLFDRLIPAYRRFHRDLLFHQPEHELWRPFLLARAVQTLLRLGGPWDQEQRLVEGAIDELNEFIGHRPVATLNTPQHLEPYAHEWVAPIPLYRSGVGVAVGKYRPLIEATLKILRETSPDILRRAQFDPDNLDELCLDPRAYDFDHPVNKRANYHFGQWDPHHIDNSGRYRRMVLPQVTLDGMLERIHGGSGPDADELLYEAAAVLAGTILMASGVSGAGPEAYDSSVSLSALMPIIASYRDEFYEQLLERAKGRYGARLKAEAKTKRQPFAGARQHLNHYLARCRASQLEHVQLALLFARMGYADAARRQAEIVAVPSARMTCEIRCRLSAAALAMERAELNAAMQALRESEDLVHRAIECGALVDPWNILGFQGQFSLFPSPENTVPDHRVPQLIELVSDIFSLQAKLWSEAAARDDAALQEDLSRSLAELARWWDQFASVTIEDVESFRAAEAFVSALQVADAMRAWHLGGTATGDIAFWRQHVEKFTSPRAYGLVVDALLAKRDFVSALALLVQWLSQADTISLAQGEYSFHHLARRWLAALLHPDSSRKQVGSPEAAKLVPRFFDLLEANAEIYWQVPALDLSTADEIPQELPENGLADDDEDGEDEEADEEPSEGLFAAAYEEMVYRDSTSDGTDADMLESGPGPITEFELDAESRRLEDRLEFLSTLAAQWRSVASATIASQNADLLDGDFFDQWLARAEANGQQLLQLLQTIGARRIPPPTASRDSLLEFDRRRGVKFALIEQVAATAVDTYNAARLMRALAGSDAPTAKTDPAAALLRAVAQRKISQARKVWPKFLKWLGKQTVLYVPPTRGGDPQKMVWAEQLQHTIRDLLRLLPRMGMITETCELIQIARVIEVDHPIGAHAVTEFDRLFEVAYKSLVESIVQASDSWKAAPRRQSSELDLVDTLEMLAETLLNEWLAHSRTLRLSVLERVLDDQAWQDLVKFIQTYGHDLFVQNFLGLGNLRAILHGGVESWFDHMQAEESDDTYRLIEDLDRGISRDQAAANLTLVLEAVVENYTEYRDYNNTTTQSDRGELMYMFLDFLRVRAQYERVAWQLRPVILTHEVLVRHNKIEAAETWRRAVADRTSDVADSLARRLAALPEKYGMRLPSIADRVAERFVRPLVIDRVKALVRPAMDEIWRSDANEVSSTGGRYFELLEQECVELTQEPSGVGLEVPGWLRAIEHEVQRSWQALSHPELAAEAEPPIPQCPLSQDAIMRQLAEWDDDAD